MSDFYVNECVSGEDRNFTMRLGYVVVEKLFAYTVVVSNIVYAYRFSKKSQSVSDILQSVNNMNIWNFPLLFPS